MMTTPLEVISCSRISDENGKAVHEECYVKRIASSLGIPLSTEMAN